MRLNGRFRLLLLLGLGMVAVLYFAILRRSADQQAFPGYVLGIYEIPQGTYLCLEYWLKIPGDGYVDFPTYRYEHGKLSGSLDPLPDWTMVKGFIGFGVSLKQGSGAASFLKTIEHFPLDISTPPTIGIFDYEIKSPTIRVRAVERSGKITISIDEQFQVLNPGESWNLQVAGPDGDSIDHRFTNYGLLDRSQITLH